MGVTILNVEGGEVRNRSRNDIPEVVWDSQNVARIASDRLFSNRITSF